MTIKTQLDLYTSAHKHALNTLPLTTDLAVESAMLEGFTTDAGDAADYPFWRDSFTEARTHFGALAKLPAKSALAPKPATPAVASAT